MNKLLLMSGGDVPFPEGELVIHVPTLKEISYLGDHNFLHGVEIVNFSKEKLTVKDKTVLEKQSNFDIFMTVMQSHEPELIESKTCANMLLDLMFGEYQVQILKDRILFIKQVENGLENGFLDNHNYEQFKTHIVDIFCLKQLQLDGDRGYNPANERAKMLAEKFQKRREKLAEMHPDQEEKSLFQKYISILAVGEQKSINDLMQYTVFQLLDEYNRYIHKVDYDTWFKARLAGASDMETPDHWMK